MRVLALLGALGAATLAPSVRAEDAHRQDPANPETPASEDDALRADLVRQGRAIEDLRARLENEEHKRENPPIRVSGFVQADWVVHNQSSQSDIDWSTGQPLNLDRFSLRRGHVRLDAEQGLVLGSLEVDANTTSGPQLRPIDAEVSVQWPQKPNGGLPALMATIGLMRIPFGYEVQELDYVRPFLERATMLEALFPGEFDLGIRVNVRYRFMDWAIAVMNGNPIGDRVFPDLDPVQAKDLVGRLGVDFEMVRGVRLQAGVSGEAGTGFHPGSPATKNQLVWQDQNGDGVVQPNEITAIGGTPATPSQVFRRFALGGDLRILARIAPLGMLSFRVEAIDAQNLDRGLEVADPVGAGHDLREMGYSVGATQEITGWAMVGARYDLYNPNGDASQQRATNLVPINRSYSTVALMGMARYGAEHGSCSNTISTETRSVSARTARRRRSQTTR